MRKGGINIKYTIVTNNPKCAQYYQGKCNVDFDGLWTGYDVLLRVRDMLHRGAFLLTHPETSSLKPNQTPYRSIIVADKTYEDKKPFADILTVENSIEIHERFIRQRKLPDWPEFIKEDFMTIDLSMVQNAIDNRRLIQPGGEE